MVLPGPGLPWSRGPAGARFGCAATRHGSPVFAVLHLVKSASCECPRQNVKANLLFSFKTKGGKKKKKAGAESVFLAS